MARKHVPPSRLRYEASHPCVSFRVTQEELKKLQEIRKRTGLSLAEIARRSIDVHAKQTRDAYERGKKAGLREGLGQFEAPCSVCNKPMRFDLKSAKDATAAAAVRQTFSRWGHTTCLESHG